MLAAVVPQLEADSLLERLGTLVKHVPEPGEAVARAYYEKHKDLFVEPEQVKLSVILLKVDPSSPQAVWNSAKDEAQKPSTASSRPAPISPSSRSCTPATARPRRAGRWTTPTAACCPKRCTAWSMR